MPVHEWAATCCARVSWFLQVWYGGRTAKNINVHRLVGYVDQYDNHLPLLTVKETLEFSLQSLVDFSDQPAELQAITAKKVENITRLMGLTNAADTILGNDLLRGVSGGERKRVTIAEMMMGTYRAVMFGTWPHIHCIVAPCMHGGAGVCACVAWMQTKSAQAWTAPPRAML